MPQIKVYIHFVWTTKNRYPYLATEVLRKKVWQHIRDNAKDKGIYIDYINGHKEHCHCLVSLGDDQTICKLMQLIKGESSYWINQQKLMREKFEWQDEYYAVSVSESMIGKVRNYIKNQEEHHRRRDFAEEYDEMIEKFGFKRFEDGRVNAL